MRALVLLIFSLLSLVAQAETVPATPEVVSTVYRHYSSAGQYSGKTTPQEVCNFCGNSSRCYVGSYGPSSVPTSGTGIWQYCFVLGDSDNKQVGWWDLGCPVGSSKINGQCVKYTCPTTGGWNLSGDQCVRTDCQPNEVRNSDGVCVSACVSKMDQNGTKSWFVTSIGASSLSGTFCDGGCQVQLIQDVDTSPYYYTNGSKNSVQRKLMYTGGSCTGGESQMPSPNEPSKTPPQPPKEPVCGASEGVMTTSTGKVHCVPEGVPESNKPIVKKETEKQVYPDGSSKQTDTTTTRDPSTGVEHKSVGVTIGPATGGGAGTAGTPGTSTGTSTSGTTGGSPDKPVADDFCAKNPNLDLCKGNIAKEETQKKVLEELQKMSNPGDTNYDAIKNAKETEAATQALNDENKKFTDIMTGTVDPVTEKKTAWQQAMETGWMASIPASSCNPYTATIGGRQWTLDICPTAAKVSQIAEYVMWFMIVIGIFVMFTGGRRES